MKVRVQDLESEKRFFWKSYLLGKVLNENPGLSFNKKTPRLASSSFGEDIDYLLHEFIKGEDLGTRSYYDVIRLRMSEIDEVVYILKSLLEIPVKLFPKDFDRKGTPFFKESFEGTLKAGMEKHLNKREVRTLRKICQLPLLDASLKFFSHGDFKPNNFIRTHQVDGQAKKSLYVIDFEITSITNQFYDFFSIWGYAIRKPLWRRTLMAKFLKEYQLRDREEQTLFEAVKVLFLMREVGSLFRYFERNLTQSGIRVAKRYLPIRVRELRGALEKYNG